MVIKKFIVVTYDIASDRRRRKISELLEEYGVRVNESVFECFIKSEKVKEMKAKVEKIANKKKDVVLFYFLCSSCMEKIEKLGNTSIEPKIVYMV